METLTFLYDNDTVFKKGVNVLNMSLRKFHGVLHDAAGDVQEAADLILSKWWCQATCLYAAYFTTAMRNAKVGDNLRSRRGALEAVSLLDQAR